MLKQVHVRTVLAAALMVAAVTPLAAAFGGPAADPHGCCRKDVAMRPLPAPEEECCYVSAQPGPAPAAVAPVKRTLSEVALVSAPQTAIEVQLPTSSMTMSETTSSPPSPAICSSVLRI